MSVLGSNTYGNPSDMESQLFNVDEAAGYLKLKAPTIRAWILKRQIGVVRIGRSVRIRRHELDLLIERGTMPAVPHAR